MTTVYLSATLIALMHTGMFVAMAADPMFIIRLGGSAHVNEAGEVEEVSFISVETLRDDDLSQLAAFPTINALSLIDCDGISGSGLSCLAALPVLAELDLTGCRSITSDGFQHLRQCDGLQSLALPSGFSDKDTEYLVTAIGLRMLLLRGTAITDAGLRTISLLTALETLDISDTRITDAGMNFVGRLTALERISLPEGVSSGFHVPLEPLRRLREVTLSGAVDASEISWLATRPALEAIALDGCQVAADVSIDRAGYEHLQSLSADGATITDSFVGSGDHLQSIREINLSRTMVSDETMKVIALCPSLECLILNDTAITDSGIDALSRCRTLTSLSVSGTSVGDECIEKMLQLSSLNEINIGDTRISEAGARRLIERFGENAVSY